MRHPLLAQAHHLLTSLSPGILGPSQRAGRDAGAADRGRGDLRRRRPSVGRQAVPRQLEAAHQAGYA